MHSFIDILLPRTCLGCKTEGFFLCTTCQGNIKEYEYFACPICKQRRIEGRLEGKCVRESGLTRFIGAPLPYSDALVKKTIHTFKYQYVKEIAHPLSVILCRFLDQNSFSDLITPYKTRVLVAPVPLFNFRERERGFNQATEITRLVSAHFDILFAEKLLRKNSYTRPQADIHDKKTRAENIAGAFSVRSPEEAKGKIVLLLDDVYTTGATMRECATVLRKAGAAEVWGVTVARGE